MYNVQITNTHVLFWQGDAYSYKNALVLKYYDVSPNVVKEKVALFLIKLDSIYVQESMDFSDGFFLERYNFSNGLFLFFYLCLSLLRLPCCGNDSFCAFLVFSDLLNDVYWLNFFYVCICI